MSNAKTIALEGGRQFINFQKQESKWKRQKEPRDQTRLRTEQVKREKKADQLADLMDRLQGFELMRLLPAHIQLKLTERVLKTTKGNLDFLIGTEDIFLGMNAIDTWLTIQDNAKEIQDLLVQAFQRYKKHLPKIRNDWEQLLFEVQGDPRKQLFLLVVILILAGMASGCAAPVTKVTPTPTPPDEGTQPTIEFAEPAPTTVPTPTIAPTPTQPEPTEIPVVVPTPTIIGLGGEYEQEIKQVIQNFILNISSEIIRLDGTKRGKLVSDKNAIMCKLNRDTPVCHVISLTDLETGKPREDNYLDGTLIYLPKDGTITNHSRDGGPRNGEPLMVTMSDAIDLLEQNNMPFKVITSTMRAIDKTSIDIGYITEGIEVTDEGYTWRDGIKVKLERAILRDEHTREIILEIGSQGTWQLTDIARIQKELVDLFGVDLYKKIVKLEKNADGEIIAALGADGEVLVERQNGEWLGNSDETPVAPENLNQIEILAKEIADTPEVITITNTFGISVSVHFDQSILDAIANKNREVVLHSAEHLARSILGGLMFSQQWGENAPYVDLENISPYIDQFVANFEQAIADGNPMEFSLYAADANGSVAQQLTTARNWVIQVYDRLAPIGEAQPGNRVHFIGDTKVGLTIDGDTVYVVLDLPRNLYTSSYLYETGQRIIRALLSMVVSDPNYLKTGNKNLASLTGGSIDGVNAVHHQMFEENPDARMHDDKNGAINVKTTQE